MTTFYDMCKYCKKDSIDQHIDVNANLTIVHERADVSFVYEHISDSDIQRFSYYYRWQETDLRNIKWVIDRERDIFIIDMVRMDYTPSNVRADENLPRPPKYYFMCSKGEFFGLEAMIQKNDLHYIIHNPVLHIREGIKEHRDKFMALAKELLAEYFDQLNHWAFSDGWIDSVDSYSITFECISIKIHEDKTAHTII